MVLLQQYTPKHPQVIGIQASIDEIKSNLRAESERIVASNSPSSNPVHVGIVQAQIIASASAQAGQAKRDVIKNEVTKRLERLALLPKQEYDLIKLQREASVTNQIYSTMSQRYEEARINEVMIPRDVQIVDYAVESNNPIAPKKKQNVFVAALLGLFIGVVLAFALHYFNKTIKSTDDVEFYLKLPVLGHIPDYSVRQRNFYGRIVKPKRDA